MGLEGARMMRMIWIYDALMDGMINEILCFAYDYLQYDQWVNAMKSHPVECIKARSPRRNHRC